MWFKKNDTNKNAMGSSEYEFCLKRVIEVYTKVEAVESKIKLLQTDIDNLRGKFNQRLKGLSEEQRKEEAKTINTDTSIYFG